MHIQSSLMKFNSPDTNHWIVSDLHLNHNKDFIYYRRGFNDIQEHNREIINNINKSVKENDVLFSLGDFCLNTNEEQLNVFLDSIICKNIYLLFGNHPNPLKKIYMREVYKKYKEDIEVYPFRYKNVIFLGNHFECIIQGKYVVMNHFPLEIWDHMKDGSYMLCGHSHYSFPRIRKASTDGLTLDCGWEGHNSVLNFNTVIDIMSKKTIRKVDHH